MGLTASLGRFCAPRTRWTLRCGTIRTPATTSVSPSHCSCKLHTGANPTSLRERYRLCRQLRSIPPQSSRSWLHRRWHVIRSLATSFRDVISSFVHTARKPARHRKLLARPSDTFPCAEHGTAIFCARETATSTACRPRIHDALLV